MILSRNRFLKSRPAYGLLATLAVVGAAVGVARSQDAKSDADAKLAVPMAVQWKFSTNYAANNPASPTVAGETVYFSSGNRIYAVDRRTGAQKWRYPNDNALNTFVVATPVVSDGTVFFTAGDGLYALNAADGKAPWPHISIKGGAVTRPLVVGDTVYFAASNGRFYAVDVKTGGARGGVWNQGGKEGLEVGDLVADYTNADDMVYFVTSNEILSSLSLTTGVRKWAQRLNESDPRISMPVVSGESLYVASGSNLLSFRRSNGQSRWSIPFPNHIVAPPVADSAGNTYVVTGDRAIYALDPRGRGLWKQPATVEYEVLTQPLLVGTTLIISTTLGNVYAFDTATGAMKWNYAIQPSSARPDGIPTITNIAATPTVADGTLYVVSDDGALTAFRADAPDSLPPTILRLEPEQGEYLNGRPPFRISAKIADDGSGLRLDTLTLKLDDRNIPRRPSGRAYSDKPGFFYNPDTGLIEYTIFDSSGEGRAEILKDGHHSATISVKDWMGNTLVKTWTFYIDDTLPKRSKQPSGNQGQGTNRGPGGLGSSGSGGSGGGGKGGDG
jgi:outer membrane protein assembly factor BamB